MHCQLVIRVSKSFQLSKLTVIDIKKGNLSSNLCHLPHLNKHVMLTRVKSDVKLYQHLKTHIREGFVSSNVTSLFQLCPLLQHMYLENTLIVQR